MVVMVTAYGREEARQAAEGVDIKGFLTKPVTPSALLNAIMVAMGGEDIYETRAMNRQEAGVADIAKLSGAKILLVEDNEINLELALELLSVNGLNVQVARDGRQALDILAKDDFDGVLMDCQMPIMDGYDATRELRKLPRFKDLPVLAMTANAMAGDREKVLDAGMNDHIAKPINVNEMFHIMAKWIKPSKPTAETPSPVIKPKSAVLIPPLDGINTAEGLARVQGNGKLYLKLLGRLSEEHARFIDEYESAVKACDWELSKRLAHSLKGVAGNIGVERLQGACKVLEAQAEERQVESATVELARSELERVLAAIAGLGQTETETGESIDSSAVGDVLELLIKQISNYDTEAQDTLDSHYELLSTGKLKPLLKSLEKALQAYDFDMAGGVLEEMLAVSR